MCLLYLCPFHKYKKRRSCLTIYRLTLCPVGVTIETVQHYKLLHLSNAFQPPRFHHYTSPEAIRIISSSKLQTLQTQNVIRYVPSIACWRSMKRKRVKLAVK